MARFSNCHLRRSKEIKSVKSKKVSFIGYLKVKESSRQRKRKRPVIKTTLKEADCNSDRILREQRVFFTLAIYKRHNPNFKKKSLFPA